MKKRKFKAVKKLNESYEKKCRKAENKDWSHLNPDKGQKAEEKRRHNKESDMQYLQP